MVLHTVGCVLCGAQIEGAAERPRWMQQFRAVYATNERSDLAHLSGVGHREAFADLLFPQDHLSASADQIEIYLMRSRFGDPSPAPGIAESPDAWGFPFHIPCWNILTGIQSQSSLNTQDLFNFLRSFPDHLGVLYFGHNYGGLLQHRELPGRVAAGDNEFILYHGEEPEHARHDPFNIPDLSRFFTQEHTGCTRDDPMPTRSYNTDPSRDPFSKLPNEILEGILEFLPSAHVVLLKQASPAYANLALTESFWRSRFLQHQEFGFVFESFQHESFMRGNWKSLYSLVSTLHSHPAMVNRKRVWNLACSLREALEHTTGGECAGVPVQSFFEPSAPVDHRQWVTATRALRAPDARFRCGRRSLWERSLALPLGPAALFVSSVEEFGRFYVSGLRLESDDNVCYSLGYNNPARETRFCIDKGLVAGFCLAQDERGVRGIAVLLGTGEWSRWIGDSHNLPKRKLVLNSTQRTTVRFLKAGFDAFKLVALSVSDGTPSLSGVDNNGDALSLRDAAMWFPDIPDQCVSMIGLKSSQARKTSAQLLISVATPSSQLDYHDLPHIGLIHSITARIGEFGHLWGLEISYAGERHISSIGVDDIQPVERLTFEMDSVGGEHVISVDAFYMNDGPFLGFKIHTSFGRTSEFPLLEMDLDDLEWHAESICPEKRIVGFCSIVSQVRGLCDIGLLYFDPATDGRGIRTAL